MAEPMIMSFRNSAELSPLFWDASGNQKSKMHTILRSRNSAELFPISCGGSGNHQFKMAADKPGYLHIYLIV